MYGGLVAGGIQSSRSVSIGTDMISSVICLQEARPWFRGSEEGSNAAVDNEVYLKDLFLPDKTVALFGVPAPFTGTCTNQHYPAYKVLADEILSAGCDELVCVSVSDPYALNSWQVALGNDPTKIRFLADPEATFARAYGLDKDYNAWSLGLRSERFSMIVQGGVVSSFRIVVDAATDAEDLLHELKMLKENEGR